MQKNNPFARKFIAFFFSTFWIFFVVAGASVAFAALTLNSTSITGDTNSVIDATGTIQIGASTATGITIGRSGITATFPGTVTITGTTTTLQNLVISGTCTGSGCLVPGGDLSGTGASQTVVGLQGRAVSSTAPSANQVLTWNGTFWTPITPASGISAINGLANSTTSIVGAGGITVATTSPNIITITGSGTGSITINSLTTSTFQIQGTANQITVATSAPNIISLSLPQNIAAGSSPTFTGLTLTGNASTTNLSITGLAGASGCLSVSGTGAVTTSTCSGGALSGGQNNYIPLWTGASSLGTSTLQSTSTSLVTTGGFAIGTTTNQAAGNLFITGNASTTNLSITSLAGTSGCLSVSGTGAVTTSTCSGGSLSGGQNNYLPLWTGASSLGTSTLSLNGTTITQSNALNVGGNLNTTGTATFASTLTQSGGLVSLASTTITGNASTTNLSITGLAGASGCLSVSGTGAVTTSTCSGGGGGVGTSGSPSQYQTTVFSATSTLTGVAAGASGQVLTSNGGSSYPTYQNVPGVTLNGLLNPTGNASYSMGADQILFNNISLTGTQDFMTVNDLAGDASTGYGVDVNLTSGSTLNPARFAVNGTGLVINNNGTISANGIANTGNASTTNLSITGLAGASGCLSVSGTGAVTTSTCSGGSLSGGQNNYLPLWTGASSLGTSTLQSTSTSLVTTGGFAIGTTTNQAAGNLFITGNASTTNLSITSLAGASGCLSVSGTGAVTTSTCSGGTLSGGQNNYIPLWTGASTEGTSTLQATSTSLVTTGGFAIGTTTNQAAGNLFITGNASTTNLSITSLAGTSGCLSVSGTGAVTTSTCSGGGGSGTVSSGTATHLAAYESNGTTVSDAGASTTIDSNGNLTIATSGTMTNNGTINNDNGLVKNGPGGWQWTSGAFDNICDTSTAAFPAPYSGSCTGVNLVETYFTHGITFSGGSTATTLDGTHAGVEFDDVMDEYSNGSTYTVKLNACSSFSGGVCSNRVTIWNTTPSAGTIASVWESVPIHCIVMAAGTNAVTASCVSRNLNPNNSPAYTTGLTNGSANWTLQISITYSSNNVVQNMVQDVIVPRWIGTN